MIFLALPLVRTFVKQMWELDGLVWLPLLALGIAIGIFPAYGFRPECLPMLIFTLIFNFFNVPLLVSSATSRLNDNFRDQGPFVTVLVLMLLGGAAFLMIAFSPKVSAGLVSDGIQMRKIRDGARQRDYFVRIYESAAEEGIRPLIFLVPPEAGSVSSVDLVCAGLRDRGFTVITYSRRGLDTPLLDENGKKYPVSLAKLRAYWRIFRQGTALKKVNENGKNLEAERRSDIEYLLPRILALLGSGFRRADFPLILAGYGAGGSALTYLAESLDFISRFTNVKGIVSIEGRLWSAYRSDPPVAFSQPEANAGWFRRWWSGAVSRFSRLRARRITGFDTLPRPRIPSLYIVSDRALYKRRGQYRAVFETQRNSPAPSALAAFTGAGPLDYCDYPLTHPVYSLLLSGEGSKSKDPVGDTVGLIGNFAVMLLKQETAAVPQDNVNTEPAPALPDDTGIETAAAPPPEPPAAKIIIPARSAISGSFHIETRGLPDF